MNLKKLLVILPTDSPGGAENTLKRFVEHAISLGTAVTVIFISRGDRGFWNDVDCKKIYLSSNSEKYGFIVCSFRMLYSRLSGDKFDLTVTSHSHCNAFTSVLTSLKILNTKAIVLRESTNIFSRFSGLKKLLVKCLYKFYSKKALIVCQTDRMRTELLAEIPRLFDSNVVTIPNSVNYNYVVKNAKEDLNSSEPVFDFLTVGRLVPEKGLDILLEAFADSRFQLLKLGIIGDGPLREALESRVDDLGLNNRVEFLGRKSNPFPYMRKSTVCIVSSILEGFPNTLLEMMCVADRVVSTKCTGGIDLLPGIISCDPMSVRSLADAMSNAYYLDANVVERNRTLMKNYVSELSIDSYFNKIVAELQLLNKN